MADEESDLRQRLTTANVDGSSLDDNNNRHNDEERKNDARILGLTKMMDYVYRISVMSGSLYVLHVMHVFQEITRGSDVGHLWFKFGLAASVGEIEFKMLNVV